MMETPISSYFNDFPFPRIVTDSTFNITAVNKRWIEKFGKKDTFYIGKPLSSFVTKSEFKKIEGICKNAGFGKPCFPGMISIKSTAKKEGTFFPLIEYISSNPEPVYSLTLFDEKPAMTEPDTTLNGKNADKHSIEKYKKLMRAAGGTVFRISRMGYILETFINADDRQFFGNRAAVGKSVYKLFPDISETILHKKLEEVFGKNKKAAIKISLEHTQQDYEAAIEIENLDDKEAYLKFSTEGKAGAVNNLLKEYEELYRTISGLTSDFAYIIKLYADNTYRLNWISEAFETITGYKQKEVEEFENLIKLIHPVDKAAFNKHRRQIITGQRSAVELRILTKSNDIRWIKHTAQPVREPGEKRINTVYGACVDITAQKLTKEELSESLDTYRSLIGALNEGILRTNEDGKIVSANKGAEIIFDETRKELKGQSLLSGLWNMVDEDYQPLAPNDTPFYKTLTEGKALNNSIVGIYNKNNMLKWVAINTQPYYRNDSVSGIVVSIYDVTDQKKAQEELYFLSLVAQQTTSSVTITDPQHKIMWVNAAFTKLTGYSLEEATGKNPKELLTGPKTDMDVHAEIGETIKNLRSGQFYNYNYKKNGDGYWVEIFIDPMYDAKGKHLGFIAVQNDISEHFERELELKRAKEKAEEASKLKTNFLANLSHELRTPMNGILSYTDILRRDAKDENQIKMLDTVYVSGQRLLETLNLLLDLSLVETNRQEIRKVLMQPSQHIEETLRTFERLALKKGIFLRFVNEGDSLLAELDERMFNTIVSSIISNAVKFTVNGGVTVTLKKAVLNDEEHVMIVVEDTGVGIPKDKEKIIFEEFRQASEGLSRGFEGTGLGLTITKRFVALLNGTIDFTSEEGLGTTFSVSFPLYKGETTKQQFEKPTKKESVMTINDNSQPTELKGNLPKILLVENDDISKEVTEMFLEGLCEVDFASDGISALELVKKNKYDAFLMDINLGSGLNGKDVTQKIRKMKGYEKTPIIAVTAFAMKGDKEEFLNAGCTHYLSKPFERETLIELLQDVLK